VVTSNYVLFLLISMIILTGCSNRNPAISYMATDEEFYLPNSSGSLVFSVHNYDSVSGYAKMHTIFSPSMCGDVEYSDKNVPIELVGRSDTSYYVNFNIKNIYSCSELNPKICIVIETTAFNTLRCHPIIVAKNMDKVEE